MLTLSAHALVQGCSQALGLWTLAGRAHPQRWGVQGNTKTALHVWQSHRHPSLVGLLGIVAHHGKCREQVWFLPHGSAL